MRKLHTEGKETLERIRGKTCQAHTKIGTVYLATGQVEKQINKTNKQNIPSNKQGISVFKGYFLRNGAKLCSEIMLVWSHLIKLKNKP